MSRFVIEYPPGATPLDPNELGGLIPDYVTTQGELNALERDNIVEAARWALTGRHRDVLNVSFCFDLHRRMFANVWRWAGAARRTEKNLGVAKEQILTKLKAVFDDTGHWMENKIYSPDEIGARFHHRLVSVHAFPNGNGRHARIMTEVVQLSGGERPFTWGSSDLDASGSGARADYIGALKLADENDYSWLVRFVRS